MRPHRVQFKLRWIMGAVAVAALVSLAAAKVCRECRSNDTRVDTFVACVLAGVFGLGSMRRPMVFLAPVILIYVGSPRAFDYAPRFIEFFRMSIGACVLGWIVGAPAGWMFRWITRARDPLPVASKPPAPK